MESGGDEWRAERLRPLKLPFHHGGGDEDAWCVPVFLLRVIKVPLDGGVSAMQLLLDDELQQKEHEHERRLQKKL